MGESRTHYQISLTARQAVGVFVALLLALGLAYFFGLMTGLSGRETRAAEGPSRGPAPEPTAVASADLSVPPVETGVPVAAPGGGSAASTTTPPPPEPTVPATLNTFEDSAESESAPVTPGSRTTVVGAPAPAPATAAGTAAKAAPPGRPASAPAAASSASSHAAPGRVWIQAASLSSADEAHALGARLSKHGFHAVVQTGAGPKGKVYRVRVGPYRTEEEASKAVSRLSRQEKIREPWIVPEGK